MPGLATGEYDLNYGQSDPMGLRALVSARTLRGIHRHPHLNGAAKALHDQVDEGQAGLREKRLELFRQRFAFLHTYKKRVV